MWLLCLPPVLTQDRTGSITSGCPGRRINGSIWNTSHPLACFSHGWQDGCSHAENVLRTAHGLTHGHPDSSHTDRQIDRHTPLRPYIPLNTNPHTNTYRQSKTHTHTHTLNAMTVVVVFYICIKYSLLWAIRIIQLRRLQMASRL